MGKDPRTSSFIIHFALFSGQLAFAIIALLIERSVAPPEGLSADVLLVVTLVIAVGAIATGHFVSSALLTQARELPEMSERQAAGLRAFIIRMALLEAAGIVAVVSYLLSGEILFLGILAVMLVIFQFRKPSDAEWDELEKGSQAAVH